MKTFFLLSYCIISISVIYAQNPEWVVYNNTNSGLPDNEVLSIAIDGSGNKWIGTYSGGLAKFDGTKWTNYNKSNSGLPNNYVYSIAIDISGNKWIGTQNAPSLDGIAVGLAKFDGTIWTTYNLKDGQGWSNNRISSIAINRSGDVWIGTWTWFNGSAVVGGGLEKYNGIGWSWVGGSSVTSIAIDASGNMWIGTSSGLEKYDGRNFTYYSTSNSGLPGGQVLSVAIDGSSTKWIGTWHSGLVEFDGTNWKPFNVSNSGLPDSTVYSIAIDGSGNKWIGTLNGGLAKFDGTNWTTFNTSNSGLPNNWVRSIAIDGSGNKWIGTWGGGLAVYKEGGVVSVKEIQSDKVPVAFTLFQNYPNPFNPATLISYQLPVFSYVTLKVFDILGREVATLISQEKSAGTYHVTFDASKIPRGVYFYRLQTGSFTETKKLVLLR